MQRIRIKQKYYVYTLAYPNGTIFYIGKGASMNIPRIAAHLRQALTGVQTLKCEVIRQILAKGEEVVFTILAEYEREEDALAYESALIRQYGTSVTNINRAGRSTKGNREGVNEFGVVLNHVCKKLGIDWKGLANCSGVNMASISRAARGERNLRRSAVLEICAALRRFPEYQPEWEQALFNSTGLATDAQIQDAVKTVPVVAKKQRLPFE